MRGTVLGGPSADSTNWYVDVLWWREEGAFAIDFCRAPGRRLDVSALSKVVSGFVGRRLVPGRRNCTPTNSDWTNHLDIGNGCTLAGALFTLACVFVGGEIAVLAGSFRIASTVWTACRRKLESEEPLNKSFGHGLGPRARDCNSFYWQRVDGGGEIVRSIDQRWPRTFDVRLPTWPAGLGASWRMGMESARAMDASQMAIAGR